MYESVFVIIAISIGLFIKYSFTQESQRPYPYHEAFAGIKEDFLNWGKVNPKAGVFVNLMFIELHIYFGVLLINPMFEVLGMIYIVYLAMLGVWFLLGSIVCIAEAAEGLSWKPRTWNIVYSDRRKKEIKEILSTGEYNVIR